MHFERQNVSLPNVAVHHTLIALSIDTSTFEKWVNLIRYSGRYFEVDNVTFSLMLIEQPDCDLYFQNDTTQKRQKIRWFVESWVLPITLRKIGSASLKNKIFLKFVDRLFISSWTKNYIQRTFRIFESSTKTQWSIIKITFYRLNNLSISFCLPYMTLSYCQNFLREHDTPTRLCSLPWILA